MTLRVIHFGADDCHRLAVLRNAGFAVEECASLPELRAALLAEAPAAAVCVSEGEPEPQEAIVRLARACFSGPLVLFQGIHRDHADPFFDLVVPNLTPPDAWLNQLKSLIAPDRSERDHTHPSAEEPGFRRRKSPDSRADAGRRDGTSVTDPDCWA